MAQDECRDFLFFFHAVAWSSCYGTHARTHEKWNVFVSYNKSVIKQRELKIRIILFCYVWRHPWCKFNIPHMQEPLNATKNNGSPKRDESIIKSKCRRIESPVRDLCLNSSTYANIDTIKNMQWQSKAWRIINYVGMSTYWKSFWN